MRVADDSPQRVAQCSVVFVLGLLLGLSATSPVLGNDAEEPPARLVFGSFENQDNATRFAARVSRLVSVPVSVTTQVESRAAGSAPIYRVTGPVVVGVQQQQLVEQATSAGLDWWRLIAPFEQVEGATAISPRAVIEPESMPTAHPVARPVAVSASIANPAVGALAVTIRANSREPKRSSRDRHELDLDLGVQNRVFAYKGPNTADQLQYSASATLDYSADFRGGLDTLRLKAFGRWDSDDSQRTHADLRELSWTHVFAGEGDSWQLQAGVGQVFWGVVEFNHLIDIVNQTDLVEGPDGEEKLGQPLLSLTHIRDWGTLELFVLPRFRKRLFPGLDGRLSLALPIDTRATRYESGAEENRVDGIVRLSTLLGGLALDVYHFNGTRRTPRFEAGVRGAQNVLVPVYDTVKRTALAAQANSGNTAFKLEALHQRGGPKSYWAGVFGLEHSFVGALGGTADVGAVLEYHYDSRGGGAFDSVFERDLALGARLAANDVNDSQALLGLVWDTKSQERAVLLEASRRLNDQWSLELESRWFGGGEAIGRFSSLSELLDSNNKLGSLQRDDYIQLEFTRFF